MKELWIKPPDGKEFIYAIVHRKTKKAYIGRTSNSIEERLSAHLNTLRGQRHHVEDMQEDFNKYGEDYDFFILDVVDANRNCPNKIERYYMNKYESDIQGKGYNYKDRSFSKDSETSTVPAMTNKSDENFEKLIKDNGTTGVRLLRDIIRASGLKQGFIAEQIGISRQSFYRFLHGEMELRQSQIAALCEVLSLSKADKERIFFTQQK